MRDDDDQLPAVAGTQRLDKWLWYARITKSRSQAAALVGEGKVRVNRTRTDKPALALRCGDVVTATWNHRVRVLKVVGLGVRRGPAAEAQGLYEDLSPPPPPRDPALPQVVQGRPMGTGRPTKRERRLTDQLKGRHR